MKRWLKPQVDEMISVVNLARNVRQSLPRNTPSVLAPEMMPLDVAQPFVTRKPGGCVSIKYPIGGAIGTAGGQVRALCQRKPGSRVLVEMKKGELWCACVVEAAWPS